MWNSLTQLITEYQSLNLEQVIDYEKFCMMSIVWHSTKIEGCSLTETESRVLLEDGITAGGKPLTDHLMVKDHFQAFQFIKKEADQKREFSIPFIQEINAQVMQNTGSLIRTALGKLRLLQVFVDKKYFPNYQKVPQLLKDLCQAVNEKLENASGENVFHLAADVHYNFVNIHPFADGNGRTSRLLMNYILLYHNQPLLKIFTEDRVAYINALNETEEKADLNIFRKFIALQYSKFLQLEIEKFKTKKGFSLMF